MELSRELSGVDSGGLAFQSYIRSPSRALGEGSPTKTDYRKKDTLILSSLLEDLDIIEYMPEPVPSKPIAFHPLAASMERAWRVLADRFSPEWVVG